MTALPPALAPWAAQLAPFAPDLALALGGWVRRIASAIGPLAGRLPGPGEPDGVSGLGRRGPYERLLLSEWAVAEEVPDEFVRRAAEGQHLFLERPHRAEAAPRRSVAVFDAGPDQLGAPRIAQLAILVVLAARAEAAGVELAWGVAQEPARGLARGLTPDLARGLLASRSGAPPDAVALSAWRERLPPAGRDDLWLVGGPALLRAQGLDGGARVLVDDVHDPQVRQVRLVLGSRAAGRREVRLELPPREADRVRLIRDPFAAPGAPGGPAPVAAVPAAGGRSA